jgi:hypothetical protein
MFWSMVSLCFGNGQSSHLWISESAIQILPSGELKDILSDPNYERQWRNGTMFPDGGYAIDDNYGEIAHWEPFQTAYLEWIKDTYSLPWSVEAKDHIAFLMGLASHGLADQSYDAMYFRRAYVYDVDGMWTESFDMATDVAFVSRTTVQPTVDVWVPFAAILPIFDAQGHSVSMDTISQGQSRLNLAVYWVGSTASQPDLVAEYESQFPWGTSNQLNESIPGSPILESQMVASYWQSVWSELIGGAGVEPILFTHPSNGTYGHPRDHTNIESSVSMGLPIGVDSAALLPEHIQVIKETGETHPIVVDVFYGQDSHILNIDPLDDWSAGVYRVILSQDLPLREGRLLGDLSDGTDVEWWFSTAQSSQGNDEDDTLESPSKIGCHSTSVVDVTVFGMGMFGLLWRRK